MQRRDFIKTVGLSIGAVLLSKLVGASSIIETDETIGLPDTISAIVNSVRTELQKDGNGRWKSPRNLDTTFVC